MDVEKNHFLQALKLSNVDLKLKKPSSFPLQYLDHNVDSGASIFFRFNLALEWKKYTTLTFLLVAIFCQDFHLFSLNFHPRSSSSAVTLKVNEFRHILVFG